MPDLSIVDELVQECDRIVKDYGTLTKVPMSEEINAFPGASAFSTASLGDVEF